MRSKLARLRESATRTPASTNRPPPRPCLKRVLPIFKRNFPDLFLGGPRGYYTEKRPTNSKKIKNSKKNSLVPGGPMTYRGGIADKGGSTAGAQRGGGAPCMSRYNKVYQCSRQLMENCNKRALVGFHAEKSQNNGCLLPKYDTDFINCLFIPFCFLFALC